MSGVWWWLNPILERWEEKQWDLSLVDKDPIAHFPRNYISTLTINFISNKFNIPTSTTLSIKLQNLIYSIAEYKGYLFLISNFFHRLKLKSYWPKTIIYSLKQWIILIHENRFHLWDRCRVDGSKCKRQVTPQK